MVAFISAPASLRVASASINLVDAISIVRSPSSRAEAALDFGGGMWRMSILAAASSLEVAEEVAAWAWTTRRPGYCGRLRPYPAAEATLGPGTVSSAVALASEVYVAGLTASAAVRRGEFVEIAGFLHRITGGDAAVPGTGVARLEIAPRLRAAHSVGTAVRFGASSLPYWRAAEIQPLAVSWSEGAQASGLSITFEEAVAR